MKLLVLALLQLLMLVLVLVLLLLLLLVLAAEALAGDVPEDTAATFGSERSVSYIGCCFREGDDSMAFLAVSISNP